MAFLQNALTVRLWNTATGAINDVSHGKPVCFFAFSPDGKYLATASRDQTAEIWDASTGQKMMGKSMDHLDRVCHVTFSPDGKYLATASKDGTARVWKAISHREVGQMVHGEGVLSVVFSPGGRYLATTCEDLSARVWKPRGKNRQVARMYHDSDPCSPVFSPDEKYLATADGKAARVWKATSGSEVTRIDHEGVVNSLAFSPDGKVLTVISDNRTVSRHLLRPEDLIKEALSRLTCDLDYRR